MKTFKKISFPLLASLLMIFSFYSCEQWHPEEEKRELEITNGINNRAEIIQPSDWDNTILEVDTVNYTFTFNSDIQNTNEIESGDIIVSSVGEGYLRRVTDVTVSSGEVTVVTEFASLDEVIENGSFSIEEQLTQNKIQKVVYYQKGIKVDTAHVKSKEEQDLNYDINTYLDPDHKIHLTGNFQMVPTLSMDYDKKWFSLKYLKFGAGVDEQLDLAVDINVEELEDTHEVTLVGVYFNPIIVFVGVPPAALPVVLTPVIELKAGINYEIESFISSELNQQLFYETGVIYNGEEWSLYSDLNKSFTFTPPQLEATAQAKVYLKPELSVRIYGTVSPRLYGELYSRLEADINADPWWSIYAGAGFGVGINVSILSRDIYDHEWDFNDLGFEVLVADAGNPANTAPTASFTVSPTNGTTGTIFTFDASGSTDNEDPVSQLEVRWDFDGDGSWDTGWDYDKTENHQYSAEGTYTAKMEVKDTEGLTDQTTQTVTVSGGSNTPPTAIFSVSPSSGSTSTIFEFDGSDSYDNEDPTSQLQVRWDFDGNGTWDTGWDYDKTENHQYSTEGTYTAKMEVKDTEGLTDYATQTVTVDNGGGNGCDGQTTLTYGGQTYDLVEIGDQCWMAENLNIGIRIDGSEEMEDNGTIEKYCLDNDPANCDEYGGLYQWNEMMQYATQQGVQGICPDGWHLPGDDEWCTLTTYIDPTVNCDEKDWIGTDAGYKIKSTSGWYSNGNGSDAYGFAALPGGWRHEYNGGFVNLEEDARFWSSTGYGTSAAWHWRLWYNYDEVLRRYKVQDWGFSVRCVKD